MDLENPNGGLKDVIDFIIANQDNIIKDVTKLIQEMTTECRVKIGFKTKRKIILKKKSCPNKTRENIVKIKQINHQERMRK